MTTVILSGTCRAQTFNEYQVKAAFLYTFAKFVEWPPQNLLRPGRLEFADPTNIPLPTQVQRRVFAKLTYRF